MVHEQNTLIVHDENGDREIDFVMYVRHGPGVNHDVARRAIASSILRGISDARQPAMNYVVATPHGRRLTCAN